MAFRPGFDQALLAVCWHNMDEDLKQSMKFEFWASTREPGTAKFAKSFSDTRDRGALTYVIFSLWVDGEGKKGRLLCGYATVDSLPIEGRSKWRRDVWKLPSHWGPAFDITWRGACLPSARPHLPPGTSQFNDADVLPGGLAAQMIAAVNAAPKDEMPDSFMLHVAFDKSSLAYWYAHRSYPLPEFPGRTHAFRIGYGPGPCTAWVVRLEPDGRVPPPRFLRDVEGDGRLYVASQLALLADPYDERQPFPLEIAPSDRGAFLVFTGESGVEFYSIHS